MNRHSYGGHVRVDRRVNRIHAAPLTSAPTPDRGRPGHAHLIDRHDQADLNCRVVAIARDRLEHPEVAHPMADLTLLYALRYVPLRDVVIATLMGSTAGDNLAHNVATDMSWLTAAGDPGTLRRGHQLLDHLEALVDQQDDHELSQTLHSIRGLLHWSARQPIAAQHALTRAGDHALATALRHSLALGHYPNQPPPPATGSAAGHGERP